MLLYHRTGGFEYDVIENKQPVNWKDTRYKNI